METKLNLKLLKNLLRLTKSKKLKWKKDELGFYHANYENVKVQIEFFNFQRMDESSSDDTSAEISIDILKPKYNDRLIWSYSIGTEGFILLKKILSYSDKDWKKSWKRYKQKRKSMIDYLSNLK